MRSKSPKTSCCERTEHDMLQQVWIITFMSAKFKWGTVFAWHSLWTFWLHFVNIYRNEVSTVETCNLRVGGKCGIEDVIPPVILVSEKENILKKSGWARIIRLTIQTGLQERSPFFLQGPFTPEVTLKQHTHWITSLIYTCTYSIWSQCRCIRWF